MNIIYLKVAYISLTAIMTLILIYFGIKIIKMTFTDKTVIKSKTKKLISGLIVWHIYTYVISMSGVLDNYEFPPRFFLLLILPLFVFTGIFIYLNRNNDWINNIPETWLIFYQSFRIFIESIFVSSVALGILNKEVTIEGYNFDMIFAFTAPLIGYLAFKKYIPKILLIAWNYVGIAIIASIIFLFMSSIYNPQIFGSDTILLPPFAAKYPYVLVAGFLMPSAVFIHILSIVQLSKKSKLNN